MTSWSRASTSSLSPMMNLPPRISTIAEAFVPAGFLVSDSFGPTLCGGREESGAFALSFEGLRSQPASRTRAQHRSHLVTEKYFMIWTDLEDRCLSAQ